MTKPRASHTTKGGTPKPPGPKPLGRDAILRAAIAEFADKGFDATTTAGVARRAGVTQPLVHHHFASKDNLWLAALESIFTSLEELLQTLADDMTYVEPSRKLEMLARKFVLFSARHPELVRIISREGMRPGPRLEHLTERFIRPMSDLLRAEMEHAIAEGHVRPLPPEHLFFVVLGAASHVYSVSAIAEELFGKDPCGGDAARSFADTVVETLFYGLRPRA